MEPKYYVIFNVSELNKIDFEQVFETSIETVRKSVDGTLKVFRNPTGGTIISDALPVEANVNRNFSSSNQLDVTTYKGANGSTITGGVTLGSTNRSGASVINFTSTPFLLKTGNTVGITWAAATSNTSQSVRIATTAFVRTNDI